MEGELPAAADLSSLQVPHSVAADAESVASSNAADGDDENKDEADDDEDEVQAEATVVLRKDDLEEEQVVSRF